MLETIAKRIRRLILTMTTSAGSGHPTSSLSAVELMVALLFGGIFRYDFTRPDHPNNDRLIFSKGHASPLLYALLVEAGVLSQADLAGYRRFGSPLEGHPRPTLPLVDVATGSLGQGLAVGVGMAINAKYLDHLPYRTFVLVGDSEMSEGSVWEAVQLASFYNLHNLIGIMDVNRLGQRGETMFGHNTHAYEARIRSFGWQTILVDGHALADILAAYRVALTSPDRPTMIIAKTVKGKGVSFLEDQNGWHGRVLTAEERDRALREIGDGNLDVRTGIPAPEPAAPLQKQWANPRSISYHVGQMVSTRKAYGDALLVVAANHPTMVVLDAEVGNSTYAGVFAKTYPNRFFEMYIAEQAMAGIALGLSRRGKVPFASTFAAFWSRAHDQIRMASYSGAHIVCVGSHAGVAIGADGPSQMGLEDISLFRALAGSTVLYPADAVATHALLAQAANEPGVSYLRTTRNETPVLYAMGELFPIGGSKTVRQSSHDRVTVVAAGITVYEALAAYETLRKDHVLIRVIDLYSVKPIDRRTLRKAAQETGGIIVVEDHAPEGGIGEAVTAALAGVPTRITSLAVRSIPTSGTPQELLHAQGIDRSAIVDAVQSMCYETASR